MLLMPKCQLQRRVITKNPSHYFSSSDLALAVRVTHTPLPHPFFCFRALPACAGAREPAVPSGGRGSHYNTHAHQARRPRPDPCAGARAPAVSRGGAVGGAWGKCARRCVCVRARRGRASDPGPAWSLGGSVCPSVRGCHHGGRGQSGAPGLRSHHLVPAAHVREGAHPGMSRRHSLPRPAPSSVAAARGDGGPAPAFPGLQPPKMLLCCPVLPRRDGQLPPPAALPLLWAFGGSASLPGGEARSVPVANCRPALPCPARWLL